MLKRLLQVPHEFEDESFGDLGYIEHSGVLDKTQVTFDLIVKVRGLVLFSAEDTFRCSL